MENLAQKMAVDAVPERGGKIHKLSESLKGVGICPAILKAQPQQTQPITRPDNVRNPLEVFLEICNSSGREFVFDNDNRATVRLLYDYFVHPKSELDKTKGIILLGNSGTGKTRLMRCFHELCTKFNGLPKFHFKTVKELQKFITIADRKDFDYFDKLYLSPDSPNLCIDDIGTETQRMNYFGNTTLWFENFLLDRYDLFTDYGIVTHLTTNLNGDELKEFYSKRVIDRFNEMFNFVFLDGKSRRH